MKGLVWIVWFAFVVAGENSIMRHRKAQVGAWSSVPPQMSHHRTLMRLSLPGSGVDGDLSIHEKLRIRMERMVVVGNLALDTLLHSGDGPLPFGARARLLDRLVEWLALGIYVHEQYFSHWSQFEAGELSTTCQDVLWSWTCEEMTMAQLLLWHMGSGWNTLQLQRRWNETLGPDLRFPLGSEWTDTRQAECGLGSARVRDMYASFGKTHLDTNMTWVVPGSVPTLMERAELRMEDMFRSDYRRASQQREWIRASLLNFHTFGQGLVQHLRLLYDTCFLVVRTLSKGTRIWHTEVWRHQEQEHLRDPRAVDSCPVFTALVRETLVNTKRGEEQAHELFDETAFRERFVQDHRQQHTTPRSASL